MGERDASDRLRKARERSGFISARAASTRHRWKPSSYAAHENGSRAFDTKAAEIYGRAYRVNPAWLLTGEPQVAPAWATEGAPVDAEPRALLPIMGYVGAGAEILPEFEQVPPEGLDEVALPFPVPGEMVGLQVRGDSMLPRYEDGDVVVVWRDQHSTVESLLGEEAAVRTQRGQRFLKRLLRGSQKGTYNLESTNASAKTIEGVRIDWASEVYLTVRAAQIRRVARRERMQRKELARKRGE